MMRSILIAAAALVLVGSWIFIGIDGPAVHSASVYSMALKPTPINPDWVLEGNPQARSHEHSVSDDRAAYTAVWDATAGTFRWHFGWDVTVYILEGDVHVTDDDGSTRTLRAGDIAYFRSGTWATWKIDRYLKKVAFVRRPLPERPAAFIYRVNDAVRRFRADMLTLN